MQRNHCIDALKGIFIIFVIISHYHMTTAERLKYLYPFWVDIAVPGFMFISGFLYAKSYKKYNIHTFSEAYSPQYTCHKLVRYTVPFLIAFLVEMICYRIFLPESISLKRIIAIFLAGGVGPGSYYYPIMIQFIYVFPVIYFIIKKFKHKGIVICAILNFIYELLKGTYELSLSTYRMLIFRYILVIAAGCYFAELKEGEKLDIKKNLMCFFVGLLFLIIYMQGYSPVILGYWTTTSFLACLYIIPIMFFIIQKSQIKCKLLELLGRASFNICLVQMVYFNFLADKMYTFTDHVICRMIINIIICTITGVLFYLIEILITDFVVKCLEPGIKRLELLYKSYDI